MRRGALFLRSQRLEEIRIKALPKNDDSLSTVSSHNDPLLSLPISEHITSLSLTTLVDIRIIRSVLATARGHLSRLELSGLCPAQLATVGISRLGQNIRGSAPSPWIRLRALRIRLCMLQGDDAPVQINIVASEFPQLASLRISDCFPDRAASEYPSGISYKQTFSKTWPLLADLHLPAMSNSDAQAIAQYVPGLARLSVHMACPLDAEHQISALGIWHLLTDLPRLFSVVVRPADGKIDPCSADSEQSKRVFADDSPLCLNFALIRKDHPLRVLDIPQIRMAEHQLLAIRQRCLRISELNAGATSDGQHASPSGLWSVAHQGSRLFYSSCIAGTGYRNITQALSFWQA
ncbi:hypothetical protein LPJ75_001782 [Coemansia sp. RSA 2598]|nr:hypothetical protein LPJ75_001782 [Coemansia sp. RSA 2598]